MSTRYKYLATCVGAGISGLGGLYYTMDYIKGTWASEGTIEALGWLAVALVIFAVWRSLNAIWGSYLFGFLTWLYFYVPPGAIPADLGLQPARGCPSVYGAHPQHPRALQDAPVPGHHPGADSGQPEKEARKPTPGLLGLAYFREDGKN